MYLKINQSSVITVTITAEYIVSLLVCLFHFYMQFQCYSHLHRNRKETALIRQHFAYCNQHIIHNTDNLRMERTG